MDITQLIRLNNPLQIASAIDKASLFGGEVWQTIAGEDRNITNIIRIHVDPRFERILFRTNGLTEINPFFPIYFRLSYRNILFRLDPGSFRVNGDKVLSIYPREARALEERKGDRYVMPYNDDISLSLKRVERTFKEMTYDMELRIIDVSERGFGILISGHNRDYLKPDDHFWIKSVDHQPLDHHILGRVTYVAPKGYFLKRGDVRVGLALNMALNPEVFEYLKRKCLMILSA